MHNRKNSFVVIEIYKEMDIENIKFVKALKLNKSFYQTVVDILYFYISCYFTIVKTAFQKFYEYKYLEIRNVNNYDNPLVFNRKYINELIINDTGICIYIGNEKLKIPYENLIQFNIDTKINLLVLTVLGKIIIHENSVTLETNSEINQIYLLINNNLFNNSNVQNCFNNIKKYLYYHLKYNEFDYNILEYYSKIRIKQKLIK